MAAKETATRQVKPRLDAIRAELDIVRSRFDFGCGGAHLIVSAAAIAALPKGYRPAVLEFRILGPLEVVGPDGPVHLGGPKQRATLAILLLSANRVVSIDRLADELYAGARRSRRRRRCTARSPSFGRRSAGRRGSRPARPDT